MGLKKDGVAGEWRKLKLHSKELNILYSPNIVRVIKSRMKWVRHVARMWERCVQGFVGKPGGKRTLG